MPVTHKNDFVTDIDEDSFFFFSAISILQGTFTLRNFFGLPLAAAIRILTVPIVADGLFDEGPLFPAVDLDGVVGFQEFVGINGALVHPVDGPQDFPLVRDFPINQLPFEKSPALRASALEEFIHDPDERGEEQAQSPQKEDQKEKAGKDGKTV